MPHAAKTTLAFGRPLSPLASTCSSFEFSSTLSGVQSRPTSVSTMYNCPTVQRGSGSAERDHVFQLSRRASFFALTHQLHSTYLYVLAFFCSDASVKGSSSNLFLVKDKHSTPGPPVSLSGFVSCCSVLKVYGRDCGSSNFDLGGVFKGAYNSLQGHRLDAIARRLRKKGWSGRGRWYHHQHRTIKKWLSVRITS